MPAAPENVNEYRTSSYKLHKSILSEDDPNKIKRIGRSFEDEEDTDPWWWNKWFPTWQAAMPKVLKMGIEAKFSQNPKLQKPLIMTGDFTLVKAAEDRGCGIGFLAGKAYLKKDHWGRNLLGKALEDLRSKLREELQSSVTDPLPGYAFRYWRLWEEMLNEERYMSSRRRSRSCSAKPSDMPELHRKIVMPELERILASWPEPVEDLFFNLQEDTETEDDETEDDCQEDSSTSSSSE